MIYDNLLSFICIEFISETFIVFYAILLKLNTQQKPDKKYKQIKKTIT